MVANGKRRKSKLCGGFIAAFSVLPHWITVPNYGDVMIPLDMLQTK